MQNKSVLKRIALFLIVALAVSFVLPSQGVIAIGQYLEVGDNTSVYKMENDIAPQSQMQLFSSTISDSFNKIKIYADKKDIKELEEVVRDTLVFVDKSKEPLVNQLNQELVELETINTKVAKNRLLDFKKHLEENFINIEEKLNELKDITESLKNEGESNLDNVIKKINELSKFIETEKPEKSIGSSLPHENIHIEPAAPSIGDQMTQPSMSGIKSEPVSNFSKTPTSEDLEETSEVQFTEEVVKLADSLNSVVETYEYVRNNINFETYFGSRKGAKGTLQQMAGNDFDQASLLISLLRYKGIPARYVRGTIEVPVEKVMRWVGAETPEAAVKTMGSLGIPTVSVISGGTISHVRTEHVWVEAFVAYDRYRGAGPMKGQKIWVPLDPSFKQYEKIDGLDLGDLLGIDTENALDAIGGDANSLFPLTVSRVNTDKIMKKFADAEEKIEEYVKQEGLENTSSEEIFGGNRIIPQNFGLLPASLPYKTVTLIEKTSVVPEMFRESVTFSIRGAAPFDLNFAGNSDFELKVNTSDIYGKRITLSWTPATSEDEYIVKHYGGIFNTPAYLLQMKPQLKIDGQVVAEGKAVGLGYRQEFKMTMKTAGISEEEILNPVTVGGFYCVGLDYGIISPDELKKIARNIENLKSTINIDNIYTDEAMGEILNAVAKAYFIQLNMYELILERQYGVKSNKLLSEAMTGYNVKVDYMFMSPVEINESGMFIDVDRNTQSVVSIKGDKEAESAFMVLTGMVGSTMEHAIFEQMTGIPSVSTIKVLQESNERGIPLHTITADNVNEVLPILEVEQSVKNDIRDSVNAGRTVTIPEKSIQYYGWSGTGYIVMDLETGSAGYMISGGIAGGAMSVGEALSKFVGYVVTGLFAMVVFHLIETAVLVLVPCGWIVGAVKIIQAIKITLAIIGLMMFMYNASMLIEMYNATGDVYYLQELLLQISALCTLLALNLGPLKGLNQKIDGLKGEIVAIKDAVAQMQARGVPTNVTNDYLKTYGVGRILPATEAIGYFKDYGLSDDAIATIGGKFEAATIELIKNTYMKSAVIYTGQDTNAILILFRQAGNESAASGLSNSIITLSNSGIVPSVYGEYGIIQSVSGLLPAVTAINKGITSSQIKTLLGLGIEPSDYDNYGIGNQDSAEVAAEAVPKFVSKVIDPIVDSKIFNRVKDIRNNLLTSTYKGSGNFGYAETNITGLSRNEFFAHSSINKSSFTGELPNRVPDISLEPDNPVFDALKVSPDNVTIDGTDAYLRIWDSEYKILNDVAKQLGNNTNASGTIKLFTEREPCSSCSRVINKFMEMYPNIKVDVIHNEGQILLGRILI